MPNSKSASKRLRQSLDRNARHRSARAALRTQIRKVRAAVAQGDSATGETEFRLAVKKLDQAAAKRLIHPNAAARTKGRLSAALKAVKAKA